MSVERGVYAEFDSAQALEEAAGALREYGYSRMEAFSPYALQRVEKALGLPRSRLPKVVFAGGLLGAVAAFLIQVYANVWQYPQNAGGRPTLALPAFVFPTFEGMILAAAFTAFFGFLLSQRLPRLWHPAFEIEGFERASVDRFWLAVDERDDRFDAGILTLRLEARGALRVLRVEEA